MKDDADSTYIEALFGGGIAFGLTAALAFADGELSLALAALVLGLAGLAIVGMYTLSGRQPSERPHPTTWGRK